MSQDDISYGTSLEELFGPFDPLPTIPLWRSYLIRLQRGGVDTYYGIGEIDKMISAFPEGEEKEEAIKHFESFKLKLRSAFDKLEWEE